MDVGAATFLAFDDQRRRTDTETDVNVTHTYAADRHVILCNPILTGTAFQLFHTGCFPSSPVAVMSIELGVLGNNRSVGFEVKLPFPVLSFNSSYRTPHLTIVQIPLPKTASSQRILTSKAIHLQLIRVASTF